ncbi:MAG: polymer-forming cytoskeletal protein, partial [Pseudomonadota bacterium]|nr:polymer-forming cytoskeletal protein [Pseudomonadota bacterium]
SAKAEVSGNVYYKVIEMVMGSRVDGQFVHVDAEVEKPKVSIPPKALKKEDDSAVVTKIGS